MNQTILDEFSTNLKKNKYKNKLQDLILEYCTDIKGEYIYLVKIRIKKSIRNSGYGSLIMSDLIKFANTYNVRIILYPSDTLGSDINRLYEFYIKHGFFLIKKDNDNYMTYNPKQIVQKLNNTIVQV